MKELQIKISQEPAVIRCNFEDVKAQLSAKMAEYQGAVFTEESKSVAKAELASLRKTRDEIEKRRKLEEIAKAREEERKKAEEALKAAAMETPEPEVPFSLDDAEDGDDLPFPQPQTVTMWYKIIATPDELEQVEMALNSLGIYFERRQA